MSKVPDSLPLRLPPPTANKRSEEQSNLYTALNSVIDGFIDRGCCTRMDVLGALTAIQLTMHDSWVEEDEEEKNEDD